MDMDAELAAWEAQVAADSKAQEAAASASVTSEEDELAAWDAQMKKQQQEQNQKSKSTMEAPNRRFQVVLDTSVEPLEASAATLEASAASSSGGKAPEKTADSMSAAELEEVVTCVRTFVHLQSNKSDVSTADTTVKKPLSDDVPAAAASAAPAIMPLDSKTSEYDSKSVDIAKKVYERCGYMLVPEDVIKR